MSRIILFWVVKLTANSAKLMLACHVKQRGAVQLRPARTADTFQILQHIYMIGWSYKH